MFRKYRVLKYIGKHGPTTATDLKARFHATEQDLNDWSSPRTDISELFLFNSTQGAGGYTATYTLNRKGREYIDTVSREIFFALFAALVALAGAFLGSLLSGLLLPSPGIPAPTSLPPAPLL